MSKKKEFVNRISLEFSAVRDGRELWTLIRYFKRPVVAKRAAIAPALWVDHFRELLNPGELVEPILYCEPNVYCAALDDDFSLIELKNVLGAAKNNKAPGCDGVPFEFFKNANLEFHTELLKLFNLINSTGRVPNQFKRSIIFPLFKKGDSSSPADYRGLSFIDCISKIVSSLLSKRLTDFTEQNSLVSECQSGFCQCGIQRLTRFSP